jgi:hypothetical protein
MLIDETRKSAREVFELWFPVFSTEQEKEARERLFEYFHSGYIAGTRFHSLKDTGSSGCPPSLIRDDTNRNLDL